MQYIVCKSEDLTAFWEDVSECLKYGWKLYGNLVVVPQHDSDGSWFTYFQAMTKEGD